MDLRATVCHVPIANWLEAIQEVALQNPKLDDAMRNQLNRGLEDLKAVAKCLKEN